MRVVTSYQPRSGAVAGSVPETAETELMRFLERARVAAPAVARTSPMDRSAWLHAIADALDEHNEELVEIAERETALGVERLTAEVARAAGQLRFYGDVACEGSYLGVAIEEATATTSRLVRANRPLGPVAVFGASNFPFAFGVLGNDTGSAIAAGCPVLVKAHPAHVLLSARLAELAEEALTSAGAPQGTIALVVGQEAGVSLVKADSVAAVAFTGSQSGGLALWRIANERPTVIPVFAEMGTVNPVVVTRAAAHDVAKVAEGFVGSFTLGSGQFCTKPGVLFAPDGLRAAEAVADALHAVCPQPVLLTRGIADSFTAGLSELVEAGAEVVGSVANDKDGFAARATVMRAPMGSLEIGSRLLEECFGPVALVTEYHDGAELESALRTLQGSLAASVITGGEDDPDAATIVSHLSGSVGRVAVDDWPTGVACSWAQQHGGPWPATSNPSATSVGAAALDRFVRPVAYQSAPDEWLPMEAHSANPWQLPRRVNGRLEVASVDPR